MSHVIWLFSYQGSSENQKKGVEFLKPVFTNSPFIQAKKYKIALKKPDSEQFEILKKKKIKSLVLCFRRNISLFLFFWIQNLHFLGDGYRVIVDFILHRV